MRRFLLLALGLLCLGLPGVAMAQTDQTDESSSRPLELLLQQRDALGLTADQLEQIDGLRGRLRAENEPLVGRMITLRLQWRQARRAAAADRPQSSDRLERIRTAAERVRLRIQANNRQAMQQVRRLLTPAQRTQLRALVEERLRRATPTTGEETDAGGNR